MRNLTLRDPSYMGALSVTPPPLGLSLRFADTKSLIDLVSGQNLITFTRASSATYIDSSGVLQTATVNQPRFTHDPLTLQSLGLLIEEQRTNLLVRSEEFDSASWTKTGVLAFGSGSTANATTAPNGTLTADLLTESTAVNTERNCYQFGFTTTPATLSCYIKPNGRNFAGLRFYATSNNWVRVTFTLTGSGSASTISAGSSSDYSATSASIASVGNGWYRVSLTATRTGGISFSVIDFATSASPTLPASSGNEFYTGDGTSGIYVWGAQLEAGAFPTSYIPTTSSAATRSADVASITGTNFSSWYRQDEGTFFVEASKTVASNGVIFEGSDGSTFSGFTLNTSNWEAIVGTRLDWINRTTALALGNSFFPGTMSATALGKIAATLTAADAVLAAGGVIAPAAAASTQRMPVSSMFVGSRIGSTLMHNGTIRRIDYWPQRLPDSMLRALTL